MNPLEDAPTDYEYDEHSDCAFCNDYEEDEDE